MSDFMLKFDQLNGTIDKFRDVSNSLTSSQSELNVLASRLSGMSGFGIPQIQAAINNLARDLARLGIDTSDIATFVSELQSIVINYENKAVTALGGEVEEIGSQMLPLYSETGTDIGMVIDSAVAEAMFMYGDNFFEHLDPNVQQDLMFLTQSIFDGVDYEARLKILQHMHDNDGKIIFDDLVRFGIFEEGDLRTGRWGRFLQRIDLGGSRNFPALLESEFRNTRHGSSLFEMDAAMRQQRQAQVMGILAVAGIGVAANFNKLPNVSGSQHTVNWRTGAGYPKPPGWNNQWQWKLPEGSKPGTRPRWFDPQGGEWRWHAPDKYHRIGHWDYNSWNSWNSPWQNIYRP